MNAMAPSPTLVRAELDAAVARYLSLALDGAEAAVLRLTFGLDGPPCSLAAAARRLGLRPAAALRLQRRAMRALRRAALDDPESPTI
ncbi:hypothetical protein KF840_11230 [bacterium]|nr:hypothetical protein [bacterium]